MRTYSIQTVHELKLERKVTEINVKHKEYMDILKSSKICFSPFGFGEACCRGYEAVVGGAFWIKSNMYHVVTDPNILIKNKSYASVK